MATVPPSAIPSTTTASQPTDTSSGNTLSDNSENTKIGIGLGVSLGILGLAALFAGIYWLFRRRQLSRVREAKAQPILLNVEGKQELDSSTRAELPGY